MFSVIIPVYNSEEYLTRCLESLINQTSKEFELICVNDASTDKTAMILEAYISKFPYMKILTNERNRGAAYSRQRGIREASYENIAFIDADDYVTAEFAENINDDIDDESELICYGHVKINEKGRKSTVVGENKTFSPDEAMFSMNCKGEITNYLWDKVLKKSILLSINLAGGRKYDNRRGLLSPLSLFIGNR